MPYSIVTIMPRNHPQLARRANVNKRCKLKLEGTTGYCDPSGATIGVRRTSQSIKLSGRILAKLSDLGSPGISFEWYSNVQALELLFHDGGMPTTACGTTNLKK